MRMIFSVLFLMAALVGEPSSQAWAEAPAVHTNRITQQILPLPKGEDMFHFVIFGDRTGGPPEGVKVLAQAVQDTNLLDPDLVMTVGDLIQGYNGQTLWEEQMLEYRGTMRSLRMPWFPVAGNHDIYWRGDGRPPVEHEANYEKHFGPLWYWFEHKQCGFLVLHSDEGDPGNPGKARDYGEPTQQKFSDAQLEWVRKSLADMKPLRHVFVFMHHPRWATDIYPGSNWTAVHSLLRDNGNVRACFAGHIHRLRYDGVKDGIEYMALATTGGSAPGHYPRLGYLHHFNVVTVRPDGIKVATLPVGAVVDPKMFTPERAADMDLVRSMNPTPVSPPVKINADGLGAGLYQVKLVNPSQRPVEFTLSSEASASEWIITPDHQHAVVDAGGEKTFSFTYVRVQASLTAAAQAPVFLLETDYLEEDARTTLPPRRFPAQMRLGALPPETFTAALPEMALHGDGGSSGVRVESAHFNLPDGPFTLEGWVHPDKAQPTTGLIAKTQTSEYGLLAENGVPSFLVHLGDHYASAAAQVPLALHQWTHLAGVFDGQSVALFVNGQLVERRPAAGVRRRNELPLYLGADPNEKGAPTRSLAGWTDEVRLSTGVRYAENFIPSRRHQPDAETLLLFHFDRLSHGVVPDHGQAGAHGHLTEKSSLSPAP